MRPLIIVTMILLVIIMGCHNKTKKTEQTAFLTSNTEKTQDTILLKQTIKNFLENNFLKQPPKGKTFASYQLLGVSANHDTINAFIWAYIMNYSPGISGPSENSGMSIPVKISLLSSNEKFQVLNTEYPAEGENYAESVRSIFPEQFHEWIWGSEKYQTIQLLKQELLEEAIEYYDQTTEDMDRHMSASNDTLDPVTILISQEGPQMELTIIVPEDLPGYEAAMTRFVQTGEGSDPANTFNFIRQKITTPDTSEPEKTCA